MQTATDAGGWTRAGLDLATPGEITEAERAAFIAHYDQAKGEQLKGHMFLLEFRPDMLKRYLAGAAEVDAGGTSRRLVRSMSFLHYYAITGWQDGIRQHLHLQRTMGARRSQILDLVAVASLHSGPRGMQWLAEVMTDELRRWNDEGAPADFPENWKFEPDALKSGIDFSSPDLSVAERDLVLGWYQRVLGEVPRSIETLAYRKPRLLKAYRSRFENALVGGLPNQVLTHCLLQLNLYRGFGEGIRSMTLMSRGLGMSRTDILDCADTCYHYGGVDTVALLDQYAADVLEELDV